MTATEPTGNVRFVAVMCPEKSVKIASHLHYTGEGNSTKYNRMLKVLVKADNPAIDRNSFRVEDAGLVSYCVETLNDTRVLHIAVTAETYPERLANRLTERIRAAFSEKFGAQYASATEDCLTKSAKKVLEPLCAQFDDPEAADKLVAVQKQVDAVAAVTADTVSVILENQAALNDVDDKAVLLKQEARTFKKASTDVKKKFWFQNLKYSLILAAIAVLVAVCIIVPVALKASSSSEVQLANIQLGAAMGMRKSGSHAVRHSLLPLGWLRLNAPHLTKGIGKGLISVLLKDIGVS